MQTEYEHELFKEHNSGRDPPQQQACPPGDGTAAAPPAPDAPPVPAAPAQSSSSGLQGAAHMESAVSEGCPVTAWWHPVYLSDTDTQNWGKAPESFCHSVVIFS